LNPPTHIGPTRLTRQPASGAVLVGPPTHPFFMFDTFKDESYAFGIKLVVVNVLYKTLFTLISLYIIWFIEVLLIFTLFC